jgi:ferrous iron transport protein B
LNQFSQQLGWEVIFMGLTYQSTGTGILKDMFGIPDGHRENMVIALAGNPNTGKSTIFNSLTGLRQHTGNWPGKTVTNARGRFVHNGKGFTLVDLPGTYSLMSNSVEEEVARDFICFGRPDVTVVITDATCLERNLNLVLQILEITDRVVVCVNLMDEAVRKKIFIDLDKLSQYLGVPVVGTSARNGKGLMELKDAIYAVASGGARLSPIEIRYPKPVESAVAVLEPYIDSKVCGLMSSRWMTLKLLDGDQKIPETLLSRLGIDLSFEDQPVNPLNLALDILSSNGIDSDGLRDIMVSKIFMLAEELARNVVTVENQLYNEFDRKIDRILTSRQYGIPIMASLLGAVFWLTIAGANYPSGLLSSLFFGIEKSLTGIFQQQGWPEWVHGALILGVFRTLAWVISVMLPPMAIFFPLFTLLEDLGYLPRVAFNMDNFFKKCCAHGKQALTMCMGFGCNAAGVVACRIIESPRERLIATITNNFVPCNGRFPTLITLAAIFIAGGEGTFSSFLAALSVLSAVVLGIIITLIISKILSMTILKGLPSSFTLELPPYRKPQVARILIRSLLDRTLFVLVRAIVVAAPAGLIIWFMANTSIGNISLLDRCAAVLQPIGYALGMDGYILMAFILGFPANEIVIPIIIMSYMSTGSLVELDSLTALQQLLMDNGWTRLTAVCTMLFSLNHFPCGTTTLTIRKETGSLIWTLASLLIPTVTGIIICLVVAQISRLLGLS